MVEAVTHLKSHNTLIRIHGVEYQLLERLTLPNRGRWKVRGIHPPIQGKTFTVIDIEDSPSAEQLRGALQRLPKTVSGIPTLVDSDRVNGRMWMVVTWCDGTDLHNYLNRANDGKSFQPTVWESIRRIKALAHLTNALHQHCRIIHGDIKPPNLVLPSDPGSIAIIDYGSSWQIERTRGRLEGDGADVYYSAPEVFQQSTIVDGRADQFSIAVVLFRMLFGTIPYAGLGGQAGDPDCRSEFENKLDIPSEPPDELKKIPDSIRCEIELLLRRTLQLNSENRLPTTRAFVNALDSIHDRLKQARSLKPEDVPKHISVMELWRRLWKK